MDAFHEWTAVTANLIDVCGTNIETDLSEESEVSKDRLQEVTREFQNAYADHRLLETIIQRLQLNQGLLHAIYPHLDESNNWTEPNMEDRESALLLVEKLVRQQVEILERRKRVQLLQDDIMKTEKKYAELNQEQCMLSELATPLKSEHASLICTVHALEDDPRVKRVAEETKVAAARARGATFILEQLICATGINAAEDDMMKELVLSLDPLRQSLRL